MAAEPSPKVLGQLRPADTNAASLYSPPANRAVEITRLVVCNQSGAVATFRIFLDDNGTTYDETTALMWDVSIGDGVIYNEDTKGWGMTDSTGNLAVRSSVNDALTFTVFGKE